MPWGSGDSHIDCSRLALPGRKLLDRQSAPSHCCSTRTSGSSGVLASLDMHLDPAGAGTHDASAGAKRASKKQGRPVGAQNLSESEDELDPQLEIE